MMTRVFVFIFMILCVVMAQAQTFNQAPDWTKNAIWYQIMVERFWNGDTLNDPTRESTSIEPIGQIPPNDWKITPWTQQWYQKDEYAKKAGMDFKQNAMYRRYGGDLNGIFKRINYLQELGINAIYFNPLNHAPSLHKYDATYYHHIDAHFGPKPEDDKRLIATENPNDPKTWVWTNADRIFLDLVNELHKRNIKVIVDFSWNHTGTLFWAWQDILKNQQNSPYADWYEIESFDNPATPLNEFSYTGWANVNSLPEFKKVNVQGQRKSGYPYKGNLPEGVKKHIFDVTRRWLAPNGDVSKGIDGIRLDVADQIGLDFWEEYRNHVKSINPEAALIGEIWWQEWPDKLMNPADYCNGKAFDAVMQYQVYRPAKYFFSESDFSIDAPAFRDSLTFHLARLSNGYQNAMMNVASSHDTPRLITCFSNKGKYKSAASPFENADYSPVLLKQETMNAVFMYRLFQFTFPGAPHIWNGDEMGMWGADDPDCRKPLWWPELTLDSETIQGERVGQDTIEPGFDQMIFMFLSKLSDIRNRNSVLADGKFEFTDAKGKFIGYRRYNDNDEIRVYFNMNAQSEHVILPKGINYVNPLKGETNLITNKIEVVPNQAIILKKVNKEEKKK